MPLKLLQLFSWVQRWPAGAEDKGRALTGTLMKCHHLFSVTAAEALSWTKTARDAGWWRAHARPDCIRRVACSSWVSGFCGWRKRFASLNDINTLVTFRQPWHNCAINVTDSFAGSSWLVFNHNYITAHVEDTTFNAVQWHAFVSLRHDVKQFLRRVKPHHFSDAAHCGGTVWPFGKYTN